MKTTEKQCGFHTPEKTTEYINQIKKGTQLEWEDTSWHNDEADSCFHEFVEGEHFHVFFPHEEYDYDHFSIYDENTNELLRTKNIQEVIDYINKFYMIWNDSLRYITKKLDEVSMSLHEDHDTKTGDITPGQQNQIDEALETLSLVVTKQVIQNL